MTPQQSLLNDLLLAREFREAVDAALARETDYIGKALRAAVRAGDATKAAWLEGQLFALENTLLTIEKFIKR